METQHPVYEKIIDDLLTREWSVAPFFFPTQILDGLHTRISALLDSGELRPAGIGNKGHHNVNQRIRTDKILWLDPAPADPDEKAFTEQVSAFCAYMNATCYTGIRSWEFHYACFEQGAFYKKHLDRFKSDDARKFSMVTYMNRGWNADDGGQLALYLENGTVQVNPEFGTTVIFKSDRIVHEVLPAGRDRLSITGWLR